ncbi:hypothetical protein HQN90_13965 [Paenibacillus alba]|uniref:hypothetical protein n=1 Tax=Paenibacillus alba TaxID=1197127 RepID=UPI0015646E46|nr:hypothetical protein [Paenibacillus alba]NQX67222.1 hypothetical protein [Paenibacillus alba]
MAGVAQLCSAADLAGLSASDVSDWPSCSQNNRIILVKRCTSISKSNVDSLLTLMVSFAGLATSMEKAADHFNVGAAFILTRFFFVHFKQSYSKHGQSERWKYKHQLGTFNKFHNKRILNSRTLPNLKFTEIS